MQIAVISIHPTLAALVWSEGLLKKAYESKKVSFSAVNPRDFSEPPHNRVDDKPYGGGAGMVLKCEPIVRAIRSVPKLTNSRVIVLSAKGERFTQRTAECWSKLDQLILIAGRYEGIDERVSDFYADEEVSVGDAVLMGGEVAAGYIIESVVRLIPGVVGNANSLVEESFSSEWDREFEQYTRPPVFEGHAVPEVLLNGNHKEINKWRKERAIKS